MSWLSRLLNTLRQDRINRELDEEISFYLTARMEELTDRGLAPDEAREQARRQLGNPLRLRESSRDTKLMPWLESVLRDVAFGLRLCRKNIIVTAAAVVSLSLAIGACTAAFALIDALMLRPLPVKNPERLIYIGYRSPGGGDSLSFNYLLFERLREAVRSQAHLFGVSDQSRGDAIFDDAGGQPEKIYAQWISGDAFTLLGIKPALGRLLAESDDRKPGQHPVAIVSYDFWSRRFGKRADVLGRWVKIREKQLQIVGVAEEGFTGLEPGIMTDVWAPNMMWDERAIQDSGTRWFRIWGRLQSGVAPEQVRAILQPPFTQFRREQAAEIFGDGPHDRIRNFVDTTVYLRSASTGVSALRQEFERALWVLASVALLVLLIACANVAGLLVARAAARDREMGLRISIGAGRGRLIQQVVVESALISIAACALGALFAVLAAPQVASMLSTSRSIVRLPVHLDWRVLLFVAAAGSVVTFLFGLAPAVRASAVSPHDALKSGGGRQTARIGLFRPLIAAQVAFSFVVLLLAGMCLESFSKLVRTDLGFDRNNLAIVSIEAKELSALGSKASAPWQQLLDRLTQSPGIQSASLSGWALFTGTGRNKAVRIPGQAPDTYDPWYLRVSPQFLRTMRIPLLEGRDFEWRDAQPASPSAVIVNEAFVRRYFPGGSALAGASFAWMRETRLYRRTSSALREMLDTRVFVEKARRQPTIHSDGRKRSHPFRSERISIPTLWQPCFGS